MKKSICTLLALLLLGVVGSAQTAGSVTGTVLDPSQQPIPGIAVFLYGTDSNPFQGASAHANDYDEVTYTDANGNYTFSYMAIPFDSVGVGVIDCNGGISAGWYQHQPNVPNTAVTLQITTCVPGNCDVLMRMEDTLAMVTGSWVWFSAVSLMHNTTASGNSHIWSYSDNYLFNHTASTDPNYDTIMRPVSSFPSSSVDVCYKRYASCSTAQCIPASASTPLSCAANFYVDTVNSVNFSGQVVIWENSSTNITGGSIDYHWDFGDGTTSNQQYPTHTYNDTDVYYVCLTITARSGTDTCVDTYCDSIGFDSNGDLVYKANQQGFTINVIDPATIGQTEYSLSSALDLYPNPTNGNATLQWDARLEVMEVEVLSVNGQLIKSTRPTDSSLELRSLERGVYIVRVKSEAGVATKKLIVQ